MEIIRETGFRKPDVTKAAYHDHNKWQEQILIVVYINWECGDLLLKWNLFNDCNKEIRTFLVIVNLTFAEWKCIKGILFYSLFLPENGRWNLKNEPEARFFIGTCKWCFFSLSLIYASLSYSQFHNGHGYCCKRCCSFILIGESHGN